MKTTVETDLPKYVKHVEDNGEVCYYKLVHLEDESKHLITGYIYESKPSTEHLADKFYVELTTKEQLQENVYKMYRRRIKEGFLIPISKEEYDEEGSYEQERA